MTTDADTQKAGRALWWRMLRGLGWVLLALALLLGGVLLVLSTQTGRERVGRAVLDAVNEPGQLEIRVERFAGRWPFHVVVEGLSLADGEGVWLRADRADLALDGWALLGGTARVIRAEVAAARLERLPASSAPEPAAPEPFTLPRLPALPVALVVDSLHVSAARLAQPVFGHAATLDLSAALTWDGMSGQVSLDLREAGGGLTALARLERDGLADRLTLDLEARDRAGGLLAAVLGDPTMGPLAVTARGDGTGTDWDGRIDLQGAAYGEGTIDLTGGWAQAQGLAVHARLRPGAALPPDARDLIGAQAVLTTRVSLPVMEDGRAIVLDDLALTTEGVGVSGAARLDPSFEAPGGGVLRVTLDADLLKVLALAGGEQPLAIGGGTVGLRIEGPVAAPEAALRLTAREVAAEAVTLDGADLTVTARPATAGEPLLLIRADGRVSGLDPRLDEGAWPYGPHVRVDLEARFDPEASQILLDRGEVALDGAAVTANGRWSLDTQAGAVEATVTAARLAAFAPELLERAAVSATARVAQAGPQSALTFRLEAQTEDLAVRDSQFASLLGPAVGVTAAGLMTRDGVVSLTDLSVVPASGLARVSAEGQVDPHGERLRAEAQLRVDDLAGLSVLAGRPLAGALDGTVTARGGLAAPAITVEARSDRLAVGDLPLDALHLKLGADLAAAERAVDVDITAQAASQPQRLSARVSLPADGVPRFERLDASLFGVGLAAVADTPGGVRLDAPDLAPLGRALRAALGPVTPGPVRGSLNGTVILGEALSADLRGRRLIVDPGEGERLRLDKLDLAASAALAGERAISADLEAFDFVSGEIRLRKVTASVRGTVDEPTFTADVKDPDEDGLRLTVAGLYHQQADPIPFARIEALSLRYRGAQAQLSEPLRIALGADGVAIEALELALRDRSQGTAGTVSASARAGATGLAAAVELSDVPLSLLGRLPDVPRVAGRASGTVRLTATGQAQDAVLDLTVAGLGARPGLEGAVLRLDGAWDGRDARLDGRLESGDAAPLILAVAVPLGAGTDGLPVVDEAAMLQGRIAGQGEVGALMPYLPLPEHLLTGTGALDLRVSGTLGDPRIAGPITLSEGRYENLDSGLTLRKMALDAMLVGRGGAFTLSATDGSGGKVAGEGQLALVDGGFTLDTTVTLNDAHVARRDDVTARASGEIAVTGGSAQGLDVTGRINLKAVDVRIPNQLPPNVVDLETVTLRDAVQNAEQADAVREPRIMPVRLNIAIKANESVSVRGRGLDSRWGGDAQITGTASDPRLLGDVNLVRGRLDFISREFTLSRGTVVFDGGRDIDPRLDIAARHEANDIVAIVTISGTASNPSVALSSEPAMQQDAILAQLLFGKPLAELTTFELVQLAQVLATLSGAGGNFDVLGRARETLGLDVLRVSAGGSGDNPADSVSVTAGKYVTEDVYVGVKQGTQPGSSGVTVEIQLTDRITLFSDVEQSTGSSVGVRVQWDY